MSDQQNLVPPDLNVYMQHRKFDIQSEINCIGIGTITVFDSTDQTVTVSLNYLRVIKNGVATQNEDGTFANDKIIAPQDMPLLVKCPVMILQGGGAQITFPITAGDTCVILFNDRDIDNWWSTGSISAPNTDRLHDLSDALVFVGINSLAKAIQSYYNGFKINYGAASITIDPAGNITITGTSINLV